MAQQVKFYSVSTLPSNASDGGIYFVGGKEIYKGSTRYGQGRVTAVETKPTDAVRGDINVYGGVAEIYTGSEWIALGASASIGSLNKDLVGVSAGTTSIITGISESNGIITAYAQAFPTLTSPADGYVSLNGTSVAISGWDSLTSRVSAIEGIVDASNGSVTATTGSFTNLYVTSTANFTATTVEASALTVATEGSATFGGSTISQIADREALAQIGAIATASASATSNGVTVSVTTQSGGVTGVAITVPQATTITASTGASYATEGAVKNYVDAQISNVGNIMTFKGVIDGTGSAALPSTSNKTGDVYLLSNGQEYVYTTDSKWEVIGDQNAYATKTAVTASVSALTSSIAANAASIATIDASVTDLYSTKASVGTSTSAANGVSVVVSTYSNSTPDVALTIATGAIASGDTSVVTGGAVYASLVSAQAETLASAKAAVTGGSTSATADGITVSVTTASTTAAPTVTLSVAAGTIASGNTSVVTGGTVFEALCWLDASGAVLS